MNKIRRKLYLFFREFIRIFDEEKLLREAASLTFVTVLGLIPFILFLVLFLPDIPTFNVVDKLKDLLKTLLLPESAEQVGDFFDHLFERKASMGILNIIMLILSSYSLFSSITTAFNNILKINTGAIKDTFTLLIKMFSTVIIGFFIFAVLISTSSLPYFQGFIAADFIRKFTNLIVPLLCWFLLINVTYYFLPNIKLKQRSIWISAGCTAVLWFVAKIGFDFWINNLTQMKQVYGIISSFPIFLFWIYLNWILVLSGVILLAIQNKSRARHKDFQVSVQINMVINKKMTKDYVSELHLGADKQGMLREFLIELLKKEK